MSKRFWTADVHFGHSNIAKYCNRPYLKKTDLNPDGTWVSPQIALDCAERGDRFYLRNCNSRVKHDDFVIHVGDFMNRGNAAGVPGLRKHYKDYLQELTGTWTLLEGNHDKQNKVKTIGRHLITNISHFKVFATHYPTDSEVHDPELISWVHKSCDFALIGHVHDKWDYKWVHVSRGIPPFLNINIGVDARKHMPITDDEVLHIYLKLIKQRDQI